jgi:hypothetical protein
MLDSLFYPFSQHALSVLYSKVYCFFNSQHPHNAIPWKPASSRIQDKSPQGNELLPTLNQPFKPSNILQNE